MNNDERWYNNYEALKAYIIERGHLPDKHVVENRALLSWAKYQRKKIKEGTLDEEKQNCLRHYSQLVRLSILGGEERKPNEQYLTIWSFTRIVTSVRTNINKKM